MPGGVFRHLFERLKETNADEYSQGCRSRPRQHPGLGTATAPGDKRSVARAGLAEAFNCPAGACHLSFARGESSETCGKTTKEQRELIYHA
jgi:hypothetical protein